MKKGFRWEFILLIIISLPSFISLFHTGYFSMHDDQQITRLYLLDQGIKQGNIYPRWVGLLGFNFGYPLFNFYPPFVYYVAEVFHVSGASLIWSIKLTIIFGFILALMGSYLYAKRLVGRLGGFITATFYTYGFYHAVNAYVRGALSEFMSMAILPFVFLAVDNLSRKPEIKNSIWLGIAIAFMILTHPLIAFPMVFFLIFAFIYYLLVSDNRWQFILQFTIAGLTGLAISAFFWLPSLYERQFTMVDSILTKDLASFKLYYVCPFQLFNSPWGYGGSTVGCFDGMTYQLGLPQIGFALMAFMLSLFLLIKREKLKQHSKFYLIFFLTIFSLFMTSVYSAFIWNNIKYLWYLQFPWRFLTFANLFISVMAGYTVYFISHILRNYRIVKNVFIIFLVIFLTFFIYKYQRYFKPQYYLNVTDNELTQFSEIAYRISKTSFEFAPAGIKTTKTDLGVKTPALLLQDIKRESYEILNDTSSSLVQERLNKFTNKKYTIQTNNGLVFRLRTFYFPGWHAYLNNKKIDIDANNDFKLIAVNIPKGSHTLVFEFENTPVRNVGNILTIISLLFCFTVIITNIKWHPKKK